MVGLGALLLVGGAVAYLGLRAYLHSDGFRKFLSAQVSSALRVQGNFASFVWDGLAVETDRFDAVGEGFISELVADRIGTEIGFGGLSRGVWEIKSTRIHRLQISLNAVPIEVLDRSEVSEPELRKKAVMKKQPGWVPREVELESLEIGALSMQVITAKGLASAKGMGVMVLPTTGKGAYQFEIVGGNVMMPMDLIPHLRIKRIDGSFQDGRAFIDRAEFSTAESARVIAFGESNFSEGFHAYEGELDGLKCEDILNETWAKRLTGDVSSSFKFTKDSGNQSVSGELGITNGTLTALPMLDALAAYADTRRFRILHLNEARTKWRFANGEILLSDLVLGSEGLIRLEGSLSIRGEEIDGSFQLGLVPGTLARIPGAETDVFRPGPMGLLWAPIRVSGTLSDPKEDLTLRLIEAAGMRMFEQLPETGEKVFKFTRSVLGESPSQAIDRGRQVIEEGEKVFKETEDLIKGILRR